MKLQRGVASFVETVKRQNMRYSRACSLKRSVSTTSMSCASTVCCTASGRAAKRW